jgi:hypothetical protein
VQLRDRRAFSGIKSTRSNVCTDLLSAYGTWTTRRTSPRQPLAKFFLSTTARPLQSGWSKSWEPTAVSKETKQSLAPPGVHNRESVSQGRANLHVIGFFYSKSTFCLLPNIRMRPVDTFDESFHLSVTLILYFNQLICWGFAEFELEQHDTVDALSGRRASLQRKQRLSRGTYLVRWRRMTEEWCNEQIENGRLREPVVLLPALMT